MPPASAGGATERSVSNVQEYSQHFLHNYTTSNRRAPLSSQRYTLTSICFTLTPLASRPTLHCRCWSPTPTPPIRCSRVYEYGQADIGMQQRLKVQLCSARSTRASEQRTAERQQHRAASEATLGQSVSQSVRGPPAPLCGTAHGAQLCVRVRKCKAEGAHCVALCGCCVCVCGGGWSDLRWAAAVRSLCCWQSQCCWRSPPVSAPPPTSPEPAPP